MRQRSADLAWRKHEDMPSTRSASAVSLRAQDHAPAALQPAATPAAGLATSAARLQLDDASIERLTDDILRRVEKRVRIERERRGI